MLWGIDPLLGRGPVVRVAPHGPRRRDRHRRRQFPGRLDRDVDRHRPPILMAGVSAARAVEAVLSVMPLDSFVPDPALRMEVAGDPVAVPPVQQEVQQAIDRAVGKRVPLVGIERFAFYDRAAEAFAILVTGERRHYGCFLFKKGVLPEE